VAPQPRRRDAVEGVDAELDAADEVVDLADAEQVPRALLRQDRRRPVDDLVHLRLVRAERAADRDAVHGARGDRLGALDAQVVVDAALHDPVDELLGRPVLACQRRHRSSQRWVRSVDRAV
jgi:hypothetical protein